MTQKFAIPQEVVEASVRMICRLQGRDYDTLSDLAKQWWWDTQAHAVLQAALAKWIEVGKARTGGGWNLPLTKEWAAHSYTKGFEEFPVLILCLEGEPS